MASNPSRANEVVTTDRSFDTVLYTVDETAAILGCSRRTIMNYIKDKRLPFVKIAGKWKITKDNLEEYVSGKLQANRN